MSLLFRLHKWLDTEAVDWLHNWSKASFNLSCLFSAYNVASTPESSTHQSRARALFSAESFLYTEPAAHANERRELCYKREPTWQVPDFQRAALMSGDSFTWTHETFFTQKSLSLVFTAITGLMWHVCMISCMTVTVICCSSREKSKVLCWTDKLPFDSLIDCVPIQPHSHWSPVEIPRHDQTKLPG